MPATGTPTLTQLTMKNVTRVRTGRATVVNGIKINWDATT